MKRFLKIYLISFLLSSISSAGEIYSWTDENGKKHFASRPPSSREQGSSVKKSKYLSSEKKAISNSNLVGIWSSVTQKYLDEERVRKRNEIKYLFRKNGTGESFSVDSGQTDAQKYRYRIVGNTIELDCFCLSLKVSSMSKKEFVVTSEYSIITYQKVTDSVDEKTSLVEIFSKSSEQQ